MVGRQKMAPGLIQGLLLTLSTRMLFSAKSSASDTGVWTSGSCEHDYQPELKDTAGNVE